MSLKDILEQACDLLSLPRLNAYVGESRDETAQQLVATAHKAAFEIIERAEWSKLYRVLPIPGSVSSIPLPDDYHRLIAGGAIILNQDGYHPVFGTNSADQWSFISKRPSVQSYYFIDKAQMKFSPVLPPDGATMKYITRNWITGDRAIANSDMDSPLFSETLLVSAIIYRWRQNKGLPYADQLGEFEACLQREIKADRGISV